MTNHSRHLAETIYGIDRLANSLATQPQLAHSTVSGGLEFTDGDGNTVGVIDGDGKGGLDSKPFVDPTPATPSLPEITADAGFIRVRWDGLWADADDPRLPADPSVINDAKVQVIETHISLDPNFTPNRVHTFAGAFAPSEDGGAIVVGPLVEAGEYWVGIRARSVTGQPGELSGKVPIQLSGVQIDSKLFDLALRDDEIRKTADGKNEVFYGDTEPEPRPILDEEGNPVYDTDGNQLFEEFSDNDLWFGAGNMPHLYDEEAGEWKSAGDARVAAIEDAQDKLREDLDTVIVDGSGMKSFYRPTEPTAEESSEGDLWFDTSESGKNAPHIYRNGEWASVADARVSVIEQAQADLADEVTAAEARAIAEAGDLADAALDAANDHTDGRVFDSTQIADDAITTPKLKAGSVGAVAIAAEAIEGKHIKAGSITADKVLIGQGGNLLSNPDFADDGAGWSGAGVRYIPLDGKNGAPLALIPASDDTNGAYLGLGDSRAAYRFSVTPGEGYRLSGYATSGEGIAADGARIYARFHTSQDLIDGTYTWGSPSVISNPDPIDPFAWGKVDGIITAPEGAVECSIGLYAGPPHPFSMRWCLPSAQQAVGSTLIEDDSITTGKIAAGSITAESGIIGSINAGTILFGEMDGARIKARSIRSEQLIIGGTDNLLPGADGNWSAGKDGWTEFEQVLGGSLRAKGEKTLHNDDEFYVPAGEYLLEATLDASVPGTVCFMQLQDLGTYSIRMEPNGDGWQKFSGTMNVAEGGKTRLTVFANDPEGAANPDGYQWFKDLSLRSKAGATLIQNGAITTGKIATGAITAESGIIGSLDAGVITTGELRGELIRAGSVAAAAIAADAIDGKTITGAKIRTASAGARVEMNNNGLWQYNSYGQVMTEMSDGMFTAVGDFQTGLDGERRVVISNEQFSNAVGLRFHPDGSGPAAEISSLMAGDTSTSQWTPGSIKMESGTVGDLSQNVTLSAPSSSAYGHTRIGTLRQRDGEADEVLGGRLYVSEDGSARLRSDRGEDLQLWSNGDTDIDSDAAVSILARDGNVNVESNTGDVRLAPDSSGKIDFYLPGSSALQFNSLNSVTGVDLSLTMDADWNVSYVGSSRRYKLAEEPIADSIAGFEDKLLSIESKTWFDKATAEQYSAYLDAKSAGEECEDDLKGIRKIRRTPGVMAEDLHDAGLGMFVIYNNEGTPESVAYDRIGPALIPIVRSQRDRIDDLESRLAALEAAA